jgi:DNA-binding NarL/FixJ family response regulator
MDIPSPFPEGIRLVKKIRLLFPELKILIYSRDSESWKLKKILVNGVNGFLDKFSESKKLIYAVEQMFEKGMYFDEGIKDKFFTNHFNKEELPDLTRRERQVLELILEEKNTKEIAIKLHISVTTVETYRRNLLFKFDVKNSAGLVKQAYEKGFV